MSIIGINTNQRYILQQQQQQLTKFEVMVVVESQQGTGPTRKKLFK